MGQELIKRSKTGQVTSMWSLQALIDEPDLVQEVHEAYFQAGAEIATTNTYMVLPDRLEPHGLGHRLEEFQQSAAEMAARARDLHGSGRIAGSCGPLGFSYAPDLCPPSDEAAEVYSRVCKGLHPFVDFFLFETMSSVDQARGALMGAEGRGRPVWLALSVDDSDGRCLRSGEKVEDIFPLLEEFKPEAVLVNCSVPEACTQTIPVLAQNKHKIPVGVYANGFMKISDKFDKYGATVDVLTARKDLDPGAYAGFARGWVEDGATIVGGCCEVGPAHIQQLAEQFK